MTRSRMRASLMLAFLSAGVFGAGCGGNKTKDAARDEYCSALEASPAEIDALFEHAEQALRSLQSTHDALLTVDSGAYAEDMLWTMAGNCEMVASDWGQAVATARAFQRDWWSVRQATGVLTIEPPDPPQYPKELFALCMPEGRGHPSDRAATVRTAARHREASLAELKTVRARWSGDRDKSLAKCESSGWKRRSPPP